MAGPWGTRLVGTVLRCYPARWRRRHGDEAAELAALLIRDGTPAGSIAWNYLAGAAREWLTPRPGRRLSTVACALLAVACALGVSAGLLASTVPARAASTSPSPASTSPAASTAASTSSGQAAGHAHCRPGPAGPAPGVISAAGQSQVIIWQAWHVRSC
jgi:hypothetical protein